MYGRTLDDFEYRGIKFRWVLSPNRFIYRVYHESDLIGTIPTARVRLRHSPEAIKALYPICDEWLEMQQAIKEFSDPEYLASLLAARKEIREGKGVAAEEVMASQTDPNAHYYGVYIRCQAGESQQGTLYRLARELYASGKTLGPFYFPCGAVMDYSSKNISDLPLEDVPCPCGNPNHWFVKWSETLQDAPDFSIDIGGKGYQVERVEGDTWTLDKPIEKEEKPGAVWTEEQEDIIPKLPKVAVTQKPKRKGRPKKVAT